MNKNRVGAYLCLSYDKFKIKQDKLYKLDFDIFINEKNDKKWE